MFWLHLDYQQRSLYYVAANQVLDCLLALGFHTTYKTYVLFNKNSTFCVERYVFKLFHFWMHYITSNKEIKTELLLKQFICNSAC